MKKLLLFLILVYFTSCRTFSFYGPPTGFFYENITFNHFVSPKSELGSRQGKSCIISWFNLVTIGDASIRTSSAVAGIKEIRAVDYEIFRIFSFVYEEFCVIVHGE